SFFFQAEDGIRDRNVTGVQTCALPICRGAGAAKLRSLEKDRPPPRSEDARLRGTCRLARAQAEGQQRAAPGARHRSSRGPMKCEIGRASCREREEIAEGGGVVEGKMRR